METVPVLLACAVAAYAALPPCPQAAGTALLLACGGGLLARGTPLVAVTTGAQLGALTRLVAAAALATGAAETGWAAGVLGACVVCITAVAWLHGTTRTKKNLSSTPQ